MKISNKLDALHAMTTMRRMEISGEDNTATGSSIYCNLYDAAEAFFAEHPCDEWNRFASNINF